jgi:hypothetical protein
MPFLLDRANDPNEAYEVRPAYVPPGWFEVTCNGIDVHYFSDRAKAERYATDPEGEGIGAKARLMPWAREFEYPITRHPAALIRNWR